MKKFTLFVLAIGQMVIAQAQYWSLTGNAGTSPSSNYIGTSDTNDVIFRVDGQLSGILDMKSTAATGFGFQSLYHNYGTGNTGIGCLSLSQNTNGAYNTAVGYHSLIGATTGTNNTAVGAYAITNSATGGGCSAFGFEALTNVSSGVGNSAFGQSALSNDYTGSDLVGVGYGADVMYDGYTNSSAIGFSATITGSNTVRIGNSSVTSIGGYVGWSNISDGRFKKNVNVGVPGLSFINALKPVLYNLDATGIDTYLHAKGHRTLSPAQMASHQTALKEKEKFVYSGFIAQDVEATAKKLGYQFSGVDAPKNDNDLYSLRYSDFVVPLVKAVQELSSKNDSLQSEVDSLQSQINSIQQQIAALKGTPVTSISGGSTPYLQQNAPNPFNSTTLINYYIPAMNNNAQMVITSAAGQIVKSAMLSNSGAGQVTINAGELAAGTYFYTLYVDGRLTDTKQMILIK